VRAARQAVRLDPMNGDAQLALARALIRLGDSPAALMAASRAAELRPTNPEVREALADALWLADRPSQAFVAFGSLAGELRGADRARATAKAREVYRMHAGWAGRLVASIRPLFAVVLRRGWLSVQ
ncbi:MAG: tetratricopeptide repeat protein, partial [Chloroflexota bacterium]|nr:tetratricopeptide repeat protein [Chloroflexota bacterium]